MKTGIFYGSTTGNTETLARRIAAKLDVAADDVYDVGRAAADKAAGYDMLLLGSSTWGLGDLQDDWQDFVEKIKAADLTGKKVGFFGCGDSASYPDTFCDAMGIIREELEACGCTFVGEMDASGYAVADSRPFCDGKVIGMAADDDEPGKTDARLDAWIKAINA